jgi:hypothetical protein
MTGGRINVTLAIQSFVSCLRPDEFNCTAGLMVPGMHHLERVGLPSETCFPYSSATKVVESCRTECKNPKEKFVHYRCRRGSSRLLTNDRSIRETVFLTGPVTVTYDVY